MIGIAAGLSRLEDGDEEYLFLTDPEQEEWLRPYLEGPCRPLHPRRSLRAASRAGDRAGAARAGPGRSAPGGSSAARTGRWRRSGADVIHFPFQDAFITEVPSLYQPHDLQHLHLPELFSRWAYERRERIYRAHCERAQAVVSMTSWGRRDLIESYGLAEEKVWVVPGASVLPEYPAPTQEYLEEMSARLSLPASFLLYPAKPGHTRTTCGCSRRSLCSASEPGRRSRWSARGAPAGDFDGVRDRARDLGLDGDDDLPGLRQPKGAPRPLRARDRRSSSRAASRAGGCRSARRSPPASRSPPPRPPACRT